MQTPCTAGWPVRFRGGGVTQAPDRAREIELARLRLRHHAVEIPARRRPEMLRRFRRDDRDRPRLPNYPLINGQARSDRGRNASSAGVDPISL
jgi:hypothetical protein